MSGLVWYVSYGSNMSAARFYYYLLGGQPPGADMASPGARDQSLPRDDAAVWIPGGIYFATESQVWGGGRALYDPGIPGRAAARAYLITAEQFSDVAAQEMYREPGHDLDLTEISTRRRIELGTGRYETLVYVGHKQQVPMITFTAPWRLSDVSLLRPGDTYLRMLATGLCESHGWDADRAGEYLASIPGAQGGWTAEQIASLVTERELQIGLPIPRNVSWLLTRPAAETVRSLRAQLVADVSGKERTTAHTGSHSPWDSTAVGGSQCR